MPLKVHALLRWVSEDALNGRWAVSYLNHLTCSSFTSAPHSLAYDYKFLYMSVLLTTILGNIRISHLELDLAMYFRKVFHIRLFIECLPVTMLALSESVQSLTIRQFQTIDPHWVGESNLHENKFSFDVRFEQHNSLTRNKGWLRQIFPTFFYLLHRILHVSTSFKLFCTNARLVWKCGAWH